MVTTEKFLSGFLFAGAVAGSWNVLFDKTPT